MLSIAIIGTGYVGLVSGVCFAKIGHKVTCIDKDASKIDKLNKGKAPIYEPGLEELLVSNSSNKSLYFDTNLASHINKSDIIIVAVGTPTHKETGRIDLSYINDVIEEIINNLAKDIVIIIKSTVSIGTCDAISEKLKAATKYSCKIISNPEFLREGSAISDFLNPDRIVIGCSIEDRHIMTNLYSNHIERGIKVVYTSRITAELIKYAANAFLGMKIAFINEIASISEKIGADMPSLVQGIASDTRIGDKFLNTGPGFGGSCFPKDISEISNISNDVNSNNILINSINKSNDARINELVKSILQIAPKKEIVAIWGLAFKANTDDARDSPPLKIIESLISMGYKIKCYDPKAINSAKNILRNKVIYSDSPYEAAANSSLIIVATEWQEFKDIDVEKIKYSMKAAIIYDLRNIINKKEFERYGFQVISIGERYL